jgi:hypothetical protein
MIMTSIGSQRNCGTDTDIDDTNIPYIFASEHALHGKCVGISVTGKKRYSITLTPAEVIRCLLAMPQETIAAAVVEVGRSGYHSGNVSLSEFLPDVVKQLTVGALAAKS